MTYHEFMKRMNQENRTKNYYFAEQNIPVELKKDVIEPEFGSKFLKFRNQFYWDGVGTKSLGHTDDAENIMCVITGYKDFYLVSPFHSKFLYPGQKEAYPYNYSPVDIASPDLE